MDEKTESVMALVLAFAIIVGWIIWVASYEVYIRAYVHWHLQLNRFPIFGHLFPFFGIPSFIGLVLYSVARYVPRYKA